MPAKQVMEMFPTGESITADRSACVSGQSVVPLESAFAVEFTLILPKPREAIAMAKRFLTAA
jgi:hypothetical protein